MRQVTVTLHSFFLEKNVLLLFSAYEVLELKKKEMENVLKLAQWRNIAREEANVCCVWMVLSHLPGEGNGYPLHYSCLENSMDSGAWQATVHGVTKSQIGLSD